MKSHLRSFGIGAACVLGTAAWANDVHVEGADGYFYEVYNPAAQELVGEVIPRRSDWFFFDGERIPRLHFAEFDDAATSERLVSTSPAVLGWEALEADTVDLGEAISLNTEMGTAWVAKHTGAMTLQRHDYAKGVSHIQTADDAVSRALEVLAVSGIVHLVPHETLDVVSVASIRRAAWVETSPGRVEAVSFMDRMGNLVETFKSSYVVTFGRRYRGIPIMGSTLTVRLDAEGQLASMMVH
ncbi:MAG: hypothetical protein HN348_30590, partial [Proteobacteria bacterium]|nr:hypothetical protein [Pseudomonadota bacterium]